jgi:hypothetical protein
LRKRTTLSQREEVDSAYEVLTSFEFVFILHLMKKIMELIYKLCQVLQYKTQDILIAMRLISSIKAFIQTLRDDNGMTYLPIIL